MNADELEEWTADRFLARMGAGRTLREVRMAGLNVSTEMSELAEAIGSLSARIALTKVKGGDTSDLEEIRAEHEATLSQLAEVKPIKARTITEYGTETYWERWQLSDEQSRRHMLLDFGVKVYAAKGHEPRIEWRMPTSIN